MRNVYVAGVGSTKYGKLEGSARDLALEAAKLAVQDSGFQPKDIQAGFIGNAFSFVEKQGHLGPLVMTGLGIPHAPCSSIESACSSGASAFREAYINIAAGVYDAMLVVGTEKVSQLDTLSATTYFTYGGDFEFEGGQGASFPGLYATIARAHMHKYGTTEEQLAYVSVKNHKHGYLNPKAHLRKEITLDQVLNSPVVASPLKLLDSCPFSDGAAAVILCSEAKLKDGPRMRIAGSGRAGGLSALHAKDDLTTLPATRLAAKEAFDQSGLTIKDIEAVEVHDAFTIAEIVALEDLGFYAKGQAAKQTEDGKTQLDGELPVNCSGGLKSKGHPVGATGVGQIVEVYEQLAGRSGARQVKGVKTMLTHNVGATGASCAVHIFTSEN
jgi:acetyl-CoA C-acetyltransferase